MAAVGDEEDFGLLDLGDNGDLPDPLEDGETEVLAVRWEGEVLGELRGKEETNGVESEVKVKTRASIFCHATIKK